MLYNYEQKKVVAVLASNLDIGVAFNVVGHLAISIGAYTEREIMGRSKLFDASGISHVGISKYPFIITKVKPGRLKKLIYDARKQKEIFIVDYPQQMLDTSHDDELAEALSLIEEENLNYLGVILYGDTEAIDKLTRNFTLWR